MNNFLRSMGVTVHIFAHVWSFQKKVIYNYKSEVWIVPELLSRANSSRHVPELSGPKQGIQETGGENYMNRYYYIVMIPHLVVSLSGEDVMHIVICFFLDYPIKKWNSVKSIRIYALFLLFLLNIEEHLLTLRSTSWWDTGQAVPWKVFIAKICFVGSMCVIVEVCGLLGNLFTLSSVLENLNHRSTDLCTNCTFRHLNRNREANCSNSTDIQFAKDTCVRIIEYMLFVRNLMLWVQQLAYLRLNARHVKGIDEQGVGPFLKLSLQMKKIESGIPKKDLWRANFT